LGYPLGPQLPTFGLIESRLGWRRELCGAAENRSVKEAVYSDSMQHTDLSDGI
jgi:hypothetical protein